MYFVTVNIVFFPLDLNLELVYCHAVTYNEDSRYLLIFLVFHFQCCLVDDTIIEAHLVLDQDGVLEHRLDPGLKHTRLVRLNHNDKLFPGFFLESVTWLSNSSITLRVLVKSQSILYQYSKTNRWRRSITNLAVSLCVRLVWKYRSRLTSMHGARRPGNGVTFASINHVNKDTLNLFLSFPYVNTKYYASILMQSNNANELYLVRALLNILYMQEKSVSDSEETAESWSVRE